MKIGEVTRVAWYRFEDDPHVYTFHTAFFRDRLYENGELKVTLRANESTFPGVVAMRENISDYYFMRNATGAEVQQWLDEHPEEIVVEVKEI